MYPFLPEARRFSDQDVVGADVSDALDYLRTPVGEDLFANPARHVKLYALSKALLASVTNSTKRKLALEKAKQYVSRISLNGETEKVAAVFFPSLEKKEDRFDVSLEDYLRFGDKLVHQAVHQGRVAMESHELNLLLERAIAEKFLDAHAQDVPDEIRNAASVLEPPMAVRSFGRKLLDLGCLQSIRQGVGEGKRFYGAMTLCISAQKDGLTKEQAHQLLEEYVSRCSGTAPFTLGEAESTLNWVWGKSIGFSCKHTMDNGFEGPYCERCPLNWKKRK